MPHRVHIYFFQALLVLSIALACNADHPDHHKHEDKKAEKSPVKPAKKAVVNDLKDLKKEHRTIVSKVPIKKRPPPLKARNYKLKNTVRTVPKVLKKLPVPPRKSRRINPLKKQPKHHHRRVLQKVRASSPKVHHHQKVAQVQHKRPTGGRVNNFSRFLRAFGRQLNRPVL